MAELQFKDALGGWEGYEPGTVQRFEADQTRPRPEVWLELLPRRDGLVCSGCRQRVSAVHDTSERWVRDLPILGADTWLLVHRVRVACPTCGPKLAELSWLESYARVTARLAESVARMCKVLTIKHVAEYFALSWDTVKAIDKAYLTRTLGPVDLTGVEVIGMDEFAIQRGHRYATLVVEIATRRVLWIGRGRSREEVRPFFELLGSEGCGRLKAVVMDMNSAHDLEVKMHCPQAEVVYDLFHVVAKYGREVIDRVRVDEANRLKGDKPARRLIKGARWLLLKNPENLTRPNDQVRLKELLDANRALLRCYLLKDDLKELWQYKSEVHAHRFWRGWYNRAIRSRVPPLARFARRLRAYLPGIMAHCRWPLHTSLLEGINNKIKVIKRMAYGFRDDAYFFLKIRAAFPGNTG